MDTRLNGEHKTKFRGRGKGSIMTRQRVHIGTSGWSYDHWRDSFYPPDLGTKDLLQHYSERFHIVEINNSFYKTKFTTDFTYVRLHGPGEAYEGSYSRSALAGWTGAFSTWQRQGKEVYCFFDNDQAGYAAQNALALQEMMS